MHLSTLSLCTFWVYKFLVVSYNPDAYFLILLFLAGIVVLDFYAARKRAFSRFLIRCSTNASGITCRQLGRKSWTIHWNEICTYGTTGYSFKGANCKIVFFSTNSNESGEKSNLFEISKGRIIFEIRPALIDELGPYLPVEMKRNLSIAIRESRNSFYRVKPRA